VIRVDAERVVVAEILRPRGNRGELLAQSLTDVPGRLEHLKKATAHLPNGSDVAVEIEEAWQHQEFWVLKLAGVSSIDEAERFRGSDLWVLPGERGRLPEGEFFRTDLIGCTLKDARSGQPVGVVRGWQQYGGPPLMEVDVAGREVLVPFVPAICQRVDLTGKAIFVELPDGLLDL
jgi:16S rRNA processing protein RimM